uniref:hypothetical protein n=1 Tax=Haemophilus parahaemolyticus TaxID=735 RepID=UPI0015F1372E|nr:hypothetical protein [Haemophilus parahaemolyticus]
MADFIELVFNPDLLDNGKIPTYSRLHTKLTQSIEIEKLPPKTPLKNILINSNQ